MDASLYCKFRNCVERGDRKRAASYVSKFVDSFAGRDERKAWVRSFLESGEYGLRIRHELYQELIFPELYQGYQVEDPWSLYFLAQTIQNVYGFRKFHEQIDWETDYSLLLSCYRIASNFRDTKAQLLNCACRNLNFAIHEWPAGLCCEIEDAKSALSLARSIDSEGKHAEFLDEIEAIIEQARARKGNV